MRFEFSTPRRWWPKAAHWALPALLVGGLSASHALHAQTTIFEADFEADNGGVVFHHGTHANKWVVGSAVGHPGNSLYVSQDGGATNTYAWDGSSVCHAWFDISVPAEFSQLDLGFDWRGESEVTGGNYDYMRVWVVPTSFTPTVGSQVTSTGSAPAGRVQIGGNYANGFEWARASAELAAAYAGTNIRLVFEFRNDGSDGGEDGPAVDNIRLTGGTCAPPSGFSHVASAVSATVSFSGGAEHTFEYELRTAGVAGAGENGLEQEGTVAGSPLQLNGLTPNTAYVLYVRADCGDELTAWAPAYVVRTLQVPVTSFPWNEDFEDGNSFALQQGASVNRWAYGSAAGNLGSSIYISNDGGTSHAYSTSNTETVAHAWRDLSVPEGFQGIDLSFDWINQGESTYDYIRVWVVPVSFDPVYNTLITATGAAPDGRVRLFETLSSSGQWTTERVALSPAYEGQDIRLVFEWRNDNSSGSQPPGAIDNVGLSLYNCLVPSGVTFREVGSDGATVAWVDIASESYEYEVRSSGAAGSGPLGLTATGTVSDPSVALNGLDAETNYCIYVRSLCEDVISPWSSAFCFWTTQELVTEFPWTVDFTNDVGGLTIQNGTSTNAWHVGSVVGNPGASLYVSNDNGVTHDYTKSSAATAVHAWRDIAFPADMAAINLEFDWMNVGESTYDYIRVFVVPTSYRPVVGTTIDPGANAVDLTGILSLNEEWRTHTVVIPAEFGGTTARLVFQWRNDGSGGANPPGALDNIRVSVNSCAPVSRVTISEVSVDGFEITWPTTSAMTYRYEVRTSGEPGSGPDGLASELDNATSPATVAGLVSGTDYSVYVQAICDGEPLAWSPAALATTLPGCGDRFTDSGGLDGEYADNELLIWTLCPGPDQLLTLEFASFNTEANYDKLFLYDGDNIDAPKFASTNGVGDGNTTYGEGGWWGTTIPGPFTSSTVGGCITALFFSDGSNTRDGWDAELICETPVTEPIVVDCEGVSVPTTYCYRDNDNTVYSYEASNTARPLAISFTQGTLAEGDSITVYGGADVTAPVLYTGNNNGNLSGLVVAQVPGDGHTITLRFHSDANGSCATEEDALPAVWTVRCESGLGVAPTAGNGFRAFPNPTADVLNISVDGGMPSGTIVRVFDVSGRQALASRVLTGAGEVVALDMNGLQNGMYTVQLLLNDRILVQQVQVQR